MPARKEADHSGEFPPIPPRKGSPPMGAVTDVYGVEDAVHDDLIVPQYVEHVRAVKLTDNVDEQVYRCEQICL